VNLAPRSLKSRWMLLETSLVLVYTHQAVIATWTTRPCALFERLNSHHRVAQSPTKEGRCWSQSIFDSSDSLPALCDVDPKYQPNARVSAAIRFLPDAGLFRRNVIHTSIVQKSGPPSEESCHAGPVYGSKRRES
jgi:hypothetical protein